MSASRARADSATGISFPSFGKIADAFGIAYRRCETNADVDGAVAWLLAQPGPAFLEVIESPDPAPVPCVISRLRPDGTSEPAWLQDMSPYLDRAEYQKLMID